MSIFSFHDTAQFHTPADRPTTGWLTDCRRSSPKVRSCPPPPPQLFLPPGGFLLSSCFIFLRLFYEPWYRWSYTVVIFACYHSFITLLFDLIIVFIFFSSVVFIFSGCSGVGADFFYYYISVPWLEVDEFYWTTESESHWPTGRPDQLINFNINYVGWPDWVS